MNAKSIKRRLSLAIFFAIGVCAFWNYRSASAFGAWYASPVGNDAQDCQTPATACRTIQAAINKAADGDLVSAAGTYSVASNGESFPIQVAKALVLTGQDPATTILDASTSHLNVFEVEGWVGVFISDFTIQGGTFGISGTGSPGTGPIWGKISNNLIINNSLQGIRLYYSSVTIERNLLAWNGSGGATDAAIYMTVSKPSPSPAIVNNLILWNNGHGVYLDYSDPSITNNTIAFNLGGTGIANTDVSRPQITNNIVTFNGHHGIYAGGNSAPTNAFNEVWGNSMAASGYANYYGTIGGTGSISSDPRFVSPLDVHLLCGSPAINSGNNTPSTPSDDYDGHPRPAGGTVDMGAYEKQPPICAASLPLIRR